MAAHAKDYTWFAEQYATLAEAYCLTLVEGITADELLRRFRALPGRRVSGIAAVEAAWDAFEDGDHTEDDALADFVDTDEDPDLMLLAVTELAGWAVAVEVNGYLGVTHELLPALAEGTRLVSHFRNVNAADRFHWQEGERSRLSFEPLFAFDRHGEDAEAIAGTMAEAGFDLRGEDEDRSTDLNTEAAFALGEAITGLRLTAEQLRTADFRLGYAPRP